MIKQISLLGATGSIGASTLKVVRQNREKFAIHSLVANQDVSSMVNLCREFSPRYAILADLSAAQRLKERLQSEGLATKVLGGDEAIHAVVKESEVDIVVAAIVGAKGFLSSLAAVQAGKRILLANKETLVMGGEIIMAEVARSGATLLPIDSEHNALFQSLPKNIAGEATLAGVKSLILTASGGPFREYSSSQLAAVTLEEALKHPNWEMGAKVTIDSSTLMNKGLEFIEAHYLFNMPADQIRVVVHPESIIHSLVEYCDGSMIAQLGEADMAVPIAHALAYPDRVPSGAKSLDLTTLGALTFEAPDLERFPCLQYAQDALRSGVDALVALNAANEVVVQAFIERRIGYLDIPRIIERVLSTDLRAGDLSNAEALLAFDETIRHQTEEYIGS